ncbi:PAS domain S-box protein [Bdellovibrionota bacterium FG-1]
MTSDHLKNLQNSSNLLGDEIYRMIVESVAEGIWIVDPDGNTLFGNPAFSAMVGLTEVEILKKPIFDLIWFDDVTPVELFMERQPAQAVDRFEAKLRHKNGSARWTLISATPIFGKGGVFSGTLFLVADISDLKAVERTARENRAKVETSARLSSLGEMAAGVAHEINNPLAIIVGRVAQMKRRILSGKMEQPALISGLDTLEATSNRIAKVIQAMLRMARSDKASSIQSSSLRVIIDDVLSLSQEKFKGAGVTLEVNEFPQLNFECRPLQIS